MLWTCSYRVAANLDDINDKDRTALMEACARGHVDAARTLLDHGAQIGMQDSAGDTALVKASRKRPRERGGIASGKRGSSDPKAVRWAAANGHLETVKRLLDKGADINAQNEAGVTALMRAALVNNPAMVRLLLNGEQIRTPSTRRASRLSFWLVAKDILKLSNRCLTAKPT